MFALPQPSALWLTYLISELLLPVAMCLGQMAANRHAANTGKDV